MLNDAEYLKNEAIDVRNNVSVARHEETLGCDEMMSSNGNQVS